MVQELYVPNLRHPDPANIGDGELYSGVGAPSDSLGNNGDVYVNLTNGAIYSKAGDTWIISTGGGGGGQLVAYADGTDPSAIAQPADPTQPAFAYATGGTTASYGWNVGAQAWN